MKGKGNNIPDSNTKKGKKHALGLGLDALIPDIESIGKKDKSFFECDVDLIFPNPYQPRTTFSQDELEELSQSIQEQGIIQPLLVRESDDGYELVAGERRLRAAKMAGLTKVPVVVKDITDIHLLEISLVENIQRENLNPVEECEAYHCLISEFNLTQEEVARRVGKSRSAIANFLRLRQLPDEIKESITAQTISMGHARALLGAESAGMQLKAWKIIVAKHLSVRDTENLIKRMKTENVPREKPEPDSQSYYFRDVAESLSRQFGAKVEIKRRGKKGKVEIEFYSNADLDRIIAMMKASQSKE